MKRKNQNRPLRLVSDLWLEGGTRRREEARRGRLTIWLASVGLVVWLAALVRAWLEQ